MRLALLADLPPHGFDDVELVFINVEDIGLRYAAVRQNKLIYSEGMHTARHVMQCLNVRR
ncbi:MAG: hypothetical protein ACQET7_04670 [Thermodesulfobacteriota bacterium]